MPARLSVVAQGPWSALHTTIWPSLRHFGTALGFRGAVLLVAAVAVGTIAMFALRGVTKRHRRTLEAQGRQHQQNRDDERHTASLTRCWQQFRWIVETAGSEPASDTDVTLGLSPELAFEILRGLLGDAQKLDDDTLTKAVKVYLDQFALLLVQQGGPLSSFAEAAGEPESATESTTEDDITEHFAEVSRERGHGT